MNPKIKVIKTESELNRKHDVTVEELRAAGRFKNYTDDQLFTFIDTLKSITRILIGSFQKLQTT